MSDKFMKQEGIEVGYFSKRKKQFNDEISRGIASVGVESKVQQKKKFKSDSSKVATPAPKEKQ